MYLTNAVLDSGKAVNFLIKSAIVRFLKKMHLINCDTFNTLRAYFSAREKLGSPGEDMWHVTAPMES